MPILLHTGTILRTPADRAEDVRSTRMHPIFLDTVARHFSELNLIGAHLGNPWYEEAAMSLFWNRNLYFDLSGTTLKRKPVSWFKEILWWDDSTKSRLAPNRDLSHYQSALADTHPLDRICFGTDVPIPEMSAAMDDYKHLADGMDAPESMRRRLWGENIVRMLS